MNGPGPRISGTGSALPKRIVLNAEIESGLGVEPGWIVRRVGVRARHRVSPDEGCVQLAVLAAQRALDSAGLEAGALDLILVATTSPDQPTPSVAAELAGALGARCGAVDLNAACAGFVYGIGLAAGQLGSGLAQRVLLVGVDVITRSLDWTDPITCPIFGDGAGAVVLEAQADPTFGVQAVHFGSKGGLGALLGVEAGGVASLRGGRVHGDPFLRMDGRAIYRHATRRLVEAVRAALLGADWTLDELDWLAPHQANQRLLKAVAKRLGLGSARVLMNIESRGNTSAASVPILLDEAVRAGKVIAGQRVVLAGLGAGLVWGAVALRW